MSTVTTLHKGRTPADSLAMRLVMIRFELGLSQREAAKETGVPFGTWQGMEAGRATRRLDEHVQRIVDRYGYDREWLMWGSRSSTVPTPDPGATQGGGDTVSYPAPFALPLALVA